MRGACAYHSQNSAVVACNSCGRGLCPACDHRIRGFPFCQDCIVSGIELLKQKHDSNVRQTNWRKPSPTIAVLLSLGCPGLGAAYNGQLAKALVHFAVFISLFQVAILTNGMPLFVLGFMGAWLFEAVDAWQGAKAIRAGVVPVDNNSLIRQLGDNSVIWAASLVALGSVFFLHTIFDVQLPWREILPAMLLGLGVWWLVNLLRERRKRNLFDAAALNPYSGESASMENVASIRQFRVDKFSNQ